jgi:aryl-alcohol dehydrogenase-like predicted oxidoreductase
MIEAFAARGGVELDTAILYNQGRTQEIMGQMSAELKRKVRIATKVNPAFEPFKSLRPDSVRAQFEQSLRECARREAHRAG